MFETIWNSPFDIDQTLVNISTGMTATPDVTSDLLCAELRGKSAYDAFKEARLGTARSASFYDTISKPGLKTFGSMNK